MKTVKLGGVCELITRGISPKYTEDERLSITVLNQKCIRNKTVLYEFSRLHNLSVKSVIESKFVKSGDILVNSTGHGTLGRTALVEDVDKPLLVDSHITILRPAESLFDPRYFAYLIGQSENDFIEMATGTSGQTELPRALLNEYEVSYEPSLQEQRRIVVRLDAAFEKIDRVIELMEKNVNNVQILYRRIFSDLFSGILGEPCMLSDVCSIESRLVDPKQGVHSNNLHVGGANIESETGRIVNLKTATQEKLISSKFPFDENTVLYSKIRPYLKKVARPDFSGLCSADIYPLTPSSRLDKDYLYYLLLSDDFTQYAISGSERAGMPKVNRPHLFAYKFILPSIADQCRIVKKLDIVSLKTAETMEKYKQKVDMLSALKQSILTQAFSSGKVQ